MPYTHEWVDPEVALEYKGCKIYHVYKHDEIDNKLTYWFTTDPEAESEGDPYSFDIRNIDDNPALRSGFLRSGTNVVEQALKKAIDAGKIKFPERKTCACTLELTRDEAEFIYYQLSLLRQERWASQWAMDSAAELDERFYTTLCSIAAQLGRFPPLRREETPQRYDKDAILAHCCTHKDAPK